jgi:hypothetical protein
MKRSKSNAGKSTKSMEKKRDLIGLNVVTSEARRTLSHDKCYPNRSNDTAQRDSL